MTKQTKDVVSETRTEHPLRSPKRSALTGRHVWYPASKPDNITVEQARQAVRRVLAEAER